MIFENLIGNNKIKEELRDVIKSNNISHSYLFLGTEGIGKRLFAREFAKAVLCLGETDDKPCGKCSSCIKFDGQNNPDYKEVEPDGNSIKIAQIREMQERIYEKPIASNKKVMIINESDKMTEEAQNALLKTLEEPPEYAVIILVATNENKLLNTIKSRCLKIGFSNIPEEQIKKYIANNKIIENQSENIIKICDGSIGKLEKIAENVELYQAVENSMNMLLGGSIKNMVSMFKNFEVLYDNKDEIMGLLDYMTVITYNFVISNNMLTSKFLNIVPVIEQTKKKLNSNTNFDMCIDELLINIFDKM